MIALILLVLVVWRGCRDATDGDGRVSVSGTVTRDGELLEVGSIRFIPVVGSTGPTAGGGIDNGDYKITRGDGLVIGLHTVLITDFHPDTDESPSGPTDRPGPTGGRLPGYGPTVQFEIEIVDGDNNFDFEFNEGTDVESANDE